MSLRFLSTKGDVLPMKQRTRQWIHRVSPFFCLIGFCFESGCVPNRLGLSIAYHAEKTSVTNAAARHTTVSPYYRFDTALLSDLDDALAVGDVLVQRKMARAVLRGAYALGQTSTANEIERLPAYARKKLAKITRSSADRAVLQHHFSRLAGAAFASDLRDVDRLTSPELQRKLVSIREGVEDLPDDKGRSARKVLYAWAASMTANGIAYEESHLAEKCLAKAEKTFARIAIRHPHESNDAALITKYAPIIGVEWPTNRRYDANFDRIGGVKLSAKGQHIKVRIDPTEPTVYSYETVAKIGGRRLRQLNYVWWFSERPEMSKDDPVAGHIDGSMLRITLDVNDIPIFLESSLNCGCAHVVFVANRIESAAREEFGVPLTGKRFAVEKSVPGKYDVVVIDTFDTPSKLIHPIVISSAGYHEVFHVSIDAPAILDSLEIAEDASYQLVSYDTLDALPLKDGVASMFGPDGLVHFAGRPEGFLLAPSGILSAGQPRKRGTQRVRWDDYLHDDPHLLDKTLRLPPLD